MQLTPVEQTHADGSVIGGYASEQRGLPLLVFLHGNGFAAGAYLPLLGALQPHFDLLLLDIPGHGRSDHVAPFIGWNEAAERVHQAALATGLCADRAVYGVGHSLGGALTMLSAHRHPASYQGLVLLDPIIFPPHMLVLMRVVSALGLTERFHPHIKSTLRRRRRWDNRQQVVDYLATRAVFRDWTQDSLSSFANYAINDSDNGVELACKPEVEALFFGTLPSGLWRAIKGIQCPASLLMGQSTYPFSLRAATIAEKSNSNITQMVVPGSHCFMQEDPPGTAERVLRVLMNGKLGK
ncbi:MAG: alpha/beta hydrolase [Pseudomonadota bacterium]